MIKKEVISTTIPSDEKDLFYALSQRRYGYKKSSIQKGLIRALELFKAETMANMDKEEREAFIFNYKASKE